jgi:hypothetical protein
MQPQVEALLFAMQHALKRQPASRQVSENVSKSSQPALDFHTERYFPQLLDWIVFQVDHLVRTDEIPAAEIAILAPYLSDVLRFSLIHRLEAAGIPTLSHRPSRALRDEPVTRCLLTLASLAYSRWGMNPTSAEVAYAFVQAIAGLDIIRAQLLANHVYTDRKQTVLSSFDDLNPSLQSRISYRFGTFYEEIRAWIAHSYNSTQPLDYFLSRLFGQILSQPGFGFHRDPQAGRIVDNLIESVRKFRQVSEGSLRGEEAEVGREYLNMVSQGVIAAQYVQSWHEADVEAVFISPAHTFLMRNKPVSIQFWLDGGSRGWSERLDQPLTHPYVLSREWETGRLWSDADEVALEGMNLDMLVSGLIRRCRKQVILTYSELDARGFEERGPLLQVVQRTLRDSQAGQPYSTR